MVDSQCYKYISSELALLAKLLEYDGKTTIKRGSRSFVFLVDERIQRAIIGFGVCSISHEPLGQFSMKHHLNVPLSETM